MKNPEVKKAFILAAGLGTRLKPLTEKLPKALVPFKGKPMIENVISKLNRAGIYNILINTHHHADKMEEYFANRSGNENITLIHEAQILGTGGAIKNAEKHLSDTEAFLVYNTDVDCEVDIGDFFDFHSCNNAIASLCVKKRKSSRYKINKEKGALIGRTENGENAIYGIKSDTISKKAFCGIHIINTKIFKYLNKNENFDIIPEYMSILQKNEEIMTYDISGIYWKDLGKLQNL